MNKDVVLLEAVAAPLVLPVIPFAARVAMALSSRATPTSEPVPGATSKSASAVGPPPPQAPVAEPTPIAKSSVSGPPPRKHVGIPGSKRSLEFAEKGFKRKRGGEHAAYYSKWSGNRGFPPPPPPPAAV